MIIYLLIGIVWLAWLEMYTTKNLDVFSEDFFGLISIRSPTTISFRSLLSEVNSIGLRFSSNIVRAG